MRNADEVENAIALLDRERERLYALEGDLIPEIIEDMQGFIILDELRRFQKATIKLIEADERGQEAMKELHGLVKHKLENQK